MLDEAEANFNGLQINRIKNLAQKEYSESVISIIEESAQPAIEKAQRANSLQTLSTNLKTSVDFSDLPSIYTDQLRNRKFDLQVLSKSDPYRSKILKAVELQGKKLPYNYTIIGDDIYWSPQGLPIKGLEKRDLKLINEIANINFGNNQKALDLLLSRQIFYNLILAYLQ